MPPLENPRHERFAQELAKGKTQEEAHESAGYKPDRGNAARLANDDSIVQRVAQIQERGAIRAEITVATLTERLMRIADQGEHFGSESGLQVSRASLMDAAKLNGLVLDRKLTAEASIEDVVQALDAGED
jgi:phage terminase small subunit